MLEGATQTNPENEARMKAASVILGNTFTLGDAEYQKLIQRFPGAASQIKQTYRAFEEARQRRINYVTSDFPSRYDKLIKKLGIAPPAVDVKPPMLKALQDAKLYMSLVPDPIDAQKLDKQSGGTLMFNPHTQGIWSQGAPTARAFATGGNVYTHPPFLEFDSNLNFLYSRAPRDYEKNAGNLTMTFIHELIHIEDTAAGTDSTSSRYVNASLAASALEDPSILTVDEAVERIADVDLFNRADERFKVPASDIDLANGIYLLALAERIADQGGNTALAAEFRKNYESKIPQTPGWTNSMRLITAEAFSNASATHIRVNLTVAHDVINSLSQDIDDGLIDNVRDFVRMASTRDLPPNEVRDVIELIAVMNLNKLTTLTYVAMADTPTGSRAV
jgi:hypothetical protein